jgi:hypothetical protein
VQDIGLIRATPTSAVQAPIFIRGDDLVIRLDQRGRYAPRSGMYRYDPTARAGS